MQRTGGQLGRKSDSRIKSHFSGSFPYTFCFHLSPLHHSILETSTPLSNSEPEPRPWQGVEVLERNVQPAGDLWGEGWVGGQGAEPLRVVLTGSDIITDHPAWKSGVTGRLECQFLPLLGCGQAVQLGVGWWRLNGRSPQGLARWRAGPFSKQQMR